MISFQIGVSQYMSGSEYTSCLPWKSHYIYNLLTIWKTGGKFIVHFFQATTYISDLIESGQLHHFLLVQ